MKYVGSKRRMLAGLLQTMRPALRPKTSWFVEPFCGGCNVTAGVTGLRLANDKNPYLIAMWRELLAGWTPPYRYSLEEYLHVRDHKADYPPHVVGYVGFCSYGAKFFGGYCRDRVGKRDYWQEYRNNLLNQLPRLQGVVYTCRDYVELDVPSGSLVYCDPPYQHTTRYSEGLDYEVFWAWCRQVARAGSQVFVSEYAAPADFQCVYARSLASSLTPDTGARTGTEKVFVYREEPHVNVNP